MIAVLVACIVICFGIPALLAQTSPKERGPRRSTLEDVETGMVLALLAGNLPRPGYRDGMASLAARAAGSEPTESWLPADFRYP